MKKILIATSALALSAGFAAAEVKVGGYGFVGVTNTGGTTSVTQGVRLEFTGSTTSTAGTEFSAYVRLDVAGAGAPVATFTRSRITVKHDALTVSFGSTNGAVRTLARSLAYYGYNDGGIFGVDNATGGAGFSADSGNNVTARYDAGAFSVAVSSDVAFTKQELAVRYSANGITVGAGIDTQSRYALAAQYKTGNLSVGAGYNQTGVANAQIGYTMGAWDFGLAANTANAYGVDVGYNLGGGARLSATAGSVGGVTTIGAGAFFSF